MNRDRQSWADDAHRLCGASRVEVTGAEPSPPSRDGQQRDTDFTQVAHRGIEVGVAGEVDAFAAGSDLVADRQPARPERLATPVMCGGGGGDGYSSDRMGLSRPQRYDVREAMPAEEPVRSPGHDQSAVAAEQRQRRRVAVVVVQV